MRFIPERKDFMDALLEDTVNMPAARSDLMRTDIRKTNDAYFLDIEMCGYAKDEIEISLYNGNLTVRGLHKADSPKKEGSVVRQERYHGTCSRTYYVGSALREEDVRASYENGILTVEIPTPEKREAEQKKFISIE